ncbi:MAG: hypothetical protein IPL43_10295 [Micropruina sp.]|nr:hypothetical protein [Micropruina sp.]
MDTLPLTQLRAPSGDSTLMSWYKPHRFVMAATDTVLISIVVILTIAFRLGDDVLAPSNAGVAPHIAGGVIIAAVWLAFLDAVESRCRRVIGAGFEEFRRVLNASVYTFVVVAIGSYLTQLPLLRVFFVVTLPIGAMLLLGGRWTVDGGRAVLRSTERAARAAR